MKIIIFSDKSRSTVIIISYLNILINYSITLDYILKWTTEWSFHSCMEYPYEY